MDWEGAETAVAAALNRLDKFAELSDHQVGRSWSPGREIQINVVEDELRSALVVAVAVAEATRPDLAAAMVKVPEAYDHGWRQCRAALVDLLSYITQREQIEAIVGAAGPKLSATSLHPLVWESAARLWDNGHHPQAVQTASQALEGVLQGKIGKLDVVGAALGEAFSPDDPTEKWPRLRLPGFEPGSKAWKTAHEGAGALVRAAFQYVRNLSSHPGGPNLTDEEALEQLAVLSMAARLVERCEIVPATK